MLYIFMFMYVCIYVRIPLVNWWPCNVTFGHAKYLFPQMYSVSIPYNMYYNVYKYDCHTIAQPIPLKEVSLF